MGVLKARVGGAWVNVGVNGGPLPPGGVLGDILVKQSATLSDATWGTTMPKLSLTSLVDGTLAGVDTTPLTLGSNTGYNVIAFRSGIQGRNNGAASMLYLNYLGGEVIAGGGNAAQYPGGLTIANSAHATSKRAQLNIGTDPGWQIGQDLSANGTKDLYVYQQTNGRTPFHINAAADFLTLLGGGGTIKLPDTAWLRSGNYQFTSATGGSVLFSHNGTNFDVNGSAYFSGEVYGGNNFWFRVRGNTGIHWESWGGGWNMSDATYMRCYGGKTIYTSGNMQCDGTATCGAVNTGTVNVTRGGYIRLSGSADNNHRINHTSGTPAGSGEAMDGPQLVGYLNVLLVTIGGAQFMLAQNGNTFINAGRSYTTFSSREHKEHITSLDPDECLDHVRRWRPVEFDLIANGHHAEGFISEDHVEVTPSMVNVCAPDSERPGWANAVDYAGGTVRLTGAVQALLRRIEALENAA
jgi:hypothetical protein